MVHSMHTFFADTEKNLYEPPGHEPHFFQGLERVNPPIISLREAEPARTPQWLQYTA